MEKRARQLFILAADFISPVRTRTTFEARDRPYVTILKSVPSHPLQIEPTRKSRPARSQERAGRISLDLNDEVSTGSDSDRVLFQAMSTVGLIVTRSLPLPVLTAGNRPRLTSPTRHQPESPGR